MPDIKLLKIGVDIDGVLANFNAPFAAVLKAVGCPVDFPIDNPAWPPVWDWFAADQGVDPKIADAAWDAVKNSLAFWATLPAYPNTPQDLRSLSDAMTFGWDVYFITCRPGLVAKFQTETWLFNHGLKIPYIPTVLICDQGYINKPRLAKALKLNALIDDRPENLTGLPHGCRKFLLKRPQSDKWFDQEGYRIVTRVSCVTEMLEMLAKEQAEIVLAEDRT
jgi:hypothetical protein